MDRLIRELESGDIHLRDQWQFELKSEFMPSSTSKENKYSQEFFIFIPNSLQINETTYQKGDFYKDQTTFIRYKTPVFSFKELSNLSNPLSPLSRLYNSLKNQSLDTSKLEDELKLLGNIFRSTIRERIHLLFRLIEKTPQNDAAVRAFEEALLLLKEDLSIFLSRLGALKELVLKNVSVISVKQHFFYIEEFINHTISYYFTGLLKRMREINGSSFGASEQLIETLLIEEKQQRKGVALEPEDVENDPEKSEYIFYRHGLINKYVADALLLNTVRSSPDTSLQNIMGAFAAFIAMFVFFVLFIWQGRVFVMNSEPFIIATVILYVLKDRIKETIRNVSYRKALKWFPDFTTEIKSPDGKTSLGVLEESFVFLSEDKISEEISKARNKEFHAILEDLHRPETVLYYKKTVQMQQKGKKSDARRNSLNAIFRFNIQHFLFKADNPFQGYFTIDEATKELQFLHLPKVYHINIIMKSTMVNDEGKSLSEIKKFRLIADKNGIKRIQQVRSTSPANIL